MKKTGRLLLNSDHGNIEGFKEKSGLASGGEGSFNDVERRLMFSIRQWVILGTALAFLCGSAVCVQADPEEQKSKEAEVKEG